MSLRNHDGKITGGDLLQLGLVQSDSEGTLSALGGSLPLLNVYDVKAYGAKLDGATDDRAALEAAIAAAVASINLLGVAADVYIGTGTLYLGSVCAAPPTNPSTGNPYNSQIGVGLPVNLAAPLRIRTAGKSATTIKLSDNARNAFWINQAADYDTFKKVQIDPLTVDNNNTVGRCHILIGSMPSSMTSQRRLNYEDITIGCLDILNVPVDATQTTTAKNGILFLGDHVSALEATQTHSIRIKVGDVRQFGGDGAVQVTSWHAGSFVGGTNHYYNDIVIGDVLHDNTAAGVPTTTLSQTSVYVCGSGFGDYFQIGNVESINIGDDAIEIGAMQTGTIASLTATNPFLVALLFRHSHAATVATQRINVGPVTIKNTSSAGAVAGFIGRPVNWIGDNSLTFGEFHFNSLEWSADGFTYANQGQADIAVILTAPVAKTVFNRIKLVLTNYAIATGTGTVDYTLFKLNTTTGVVVVRDLDVAAAVAASAGAALTANLIVVSHSGSGNRLDIDNYTCDLTGSAWTNSTAGAVHMHMVAKSNGLNVTGSLRRFVPLGPVSIAGAGLRGCGVQTNAAIRGYDYTESDLQACSGISAGRDIECAGANSAKIYVRDFIGRDGIRLGPQGRRSVAADYTILPVDAATIAVTSTLSARTITLPAANAVPVGQVLTISDESNAAGTNNITVTRAGSDTFIGGTTTKAINTNGGNLKLYSTGSAWAVV